MGKARYVALDRRTAELAITIRDEYQGCGLGTLLIQEIIQSARAEDYAALVAHVHPQNYPMQALLYKLGFHLSAADCDQLCMTVRLP